VAAVTAQAVAAVTAQAVAAVAAQAVAAAHQVSLHLIATLAQIIKNTVLKEIHLSQMQANLKKIVTVMLS
jgi:hypothetical protein